MSNIIVVVMFFCFFVFLTILFCGLNLWFEVCPSGKGKNCVTSNDHFIKHCFDRQSDKLKASIPNMIQRYRICHSEFCRNVYKMMHNTYGKISI